MKFNNAELGLLVECVQARQMYYERNKYSDFASPEEKDMAREQLKMFMELNKKLKEKKSNGK